MYFCGGHRPCHRAVTVTAVVGGCGDRNGDKAKNPSPLPVNHRLPVNGDGTLIEIHLMQIYNELKIRKVKKIIEKVKKSKKITLTFFLSFF